MRHHALHRAAGRNKTVLISSLFDLLNALLFRCSIIKNSLVVFLVLFRYFITIASFKPGVENKAVLAFGSAV